MLPKERVIRALEFSRPDRIPVGETGVDYTVTEQALGRPTLYRAKWKEYTALWQGPREEYVESCKRDIPALAARSITMWSRHSWCLLDIRVRGPRVSRPLQVARPDGRVYAFSPESEGHPFLLSHLTSG